ncbi:MAG: hypothetical protein AAF570_14295 [Bacteroidota bacterium]
MHKEHYKAEKCPTCGRQRSALEVQIYGGGECDGCFKQSVKDGKYSLADSETSAVQAPANKKRLCIGSNRRDEYEQKIDLLTLANLEFLLCSDDPDNVREGVDAAHAHLEHAKVSEMVERAVYWLENRKKLINGKTYRFRFDGETYYGEYDDRCPHPGGEATNTVAGFVDEETGLPTDPEDCDFWELDLESL